MADIDSDVDMSLPTTPTRAPSVLSPSTPTPTHRSRVLRFSDFENAQPNRYSSEALYSPGDPFIDPDSTPLNKPKGNILKSTEDVFNEVRDAMSCREQIAEEYSKALDEATSRVQKLGLEQEMCQLEKALAQVIRSFARGENLISRETRQPGLSQSIYAIPQGKTSTKKPTYAETARCHLPSIFSAKLPQKPSNPVQNNARKTDNRIFIRLSEEHPSRNHHIHAIKSALINKLGLEEASIKAVQKVKSGIAIVPTNEKQAEQLLEKSQTITSVLGGKVEKAEEWWTYVVDHVPRKLQTLDGQEIAVTVESVRKEVEAAAGLAPIRVAWSRKTLENPLPTGTIVASFKTQPRFFRLFGTSSLARKITKSPKPAQCPKCWGFHDARLCNFEQRCKQCSTQGHRHCLAPPRCTNCKGPHAADTNSCPARPLVRNGVLKKLTNSELKRIRQAGHRAWLLANPTSTNKDKALDSQTNLNSTAAQKC